MLHPLCALALLLALLRPAAAEEPFHDLAFAAATARAETADKLVLVDFFTTWCGPCKRLDRTTWTDPRVRAWLAEHTVAIKVDAEREVELARRFGVGAYPTILLLHPDGRVVDRLVGYRDAAQFLEEVGEALQGRDAVARSKAAVGASPEDPSARLTLARELIAAGSPLEALMELEWCWDHGLEHDRAFHGVRLSFLLSEWARLARDYPPARESLEERRAEAERRLLAGEDPGLAAAEVWRIDDHLGRPERALALWDALAERGPEGAAAREHLGRYVFDALVAADRHADALAARPVADLRTALRLRGIGLERLEGPDAAELRAALLDGAARECALFLDALLALGETAESRRVVAAMLALDGSASTRATLADAARSAGAEDLAAEVEEGPAAPDPAAEPDPRRVPAVRIRPVPAAPGAPAAPRAATAAVASDALELDGLEVAWSRPGPYAAVAVDPRTGEAFAAKINDRCDVLDRSGDLLRTFPIPSRITLLRHARLVSPLAPERVRRGADLLGFSSWNREIHAFTAQGVPLWIAGSAAAIDDVWPGDLDGDGSDEVVVGHNATGGLHLLAADGTRRWEQPELGTTWHVAVGDVTGDGAPEIVSTRDGGVDVRDPDGALITSFRTRMRAHFVRVVRPTEPGGRSTVLVAGRGGRTGPELVAADGAGAELWHLELSDDLAHLKALVVHPDLPLAALCSTERIAVVDLRRRAVVAEVRGGTRLGQVAWRPAIPGAPPALLVTTGADLAALRLAP